MNPIGQVSPQGQLGTDAILVKPKRMVGPFSAHVTLREVHTDKLAITDQPVEQGASMTDHAFKRPAELVIEMMWSNSPQQSAEPPPPPPQQSLADILVSGARSVLGPVDAVADQLARFTAPPAVPPVQATLTGNSVDQVRDVYAKLLDLQQQRIPFDVVTGKRNYSNMLVETLVQVTDQETENALHITATLRQVLLASVVLRTINSGRENQSDAESTLPVEQRGARQLGEAPNFNPGAALRAGVDATNVTTSPVVDRVVSGVALKLIGPSP